MTKIKAFSAGTYIGAQVREALNAPPHIIWARLFVAAPTKTAAVAEVEARLRHYATRGAVRAPGLRDQEFRLATGNDVEALRAAGLFDEPAVLVVSDTAANSPVVAVTHEGVRTIGCLRPAGGRTVFAPAGGDPLRELAEWLVSLDEPGSVDRRTVTMTQIITRAREALGKED